MKDELKKQVIEKLEEYSSRQIRQGDTATSLINFIEDFKQLHDKLKDIDYDFWLLGNDNFVRYAIDDLLSTLQSLLKQPVMAAMLISPIKNQPHGTILNSFQVAYDVLGKFEMSEDLQNYYNDQLSLFQNIKKTLTQKSESGSIGGGCYIATMAYGDYDHPQVMVLRQFRDNVLDKSTIGKWFIKTYYCYSPKLVEKLEDKKFINSIVRKTLNQVIKIIK